MAAVMRAIAAVVRAEVAVMVAVVVHGGRAVVAADGSTTGVVVVVHIDNFCRGLFINAGNHNGSGGCNGETEKSRFCLAAAYGHGGHGDQHQRIEFLVHGEGVKVFVVCFH